MIPSARELEHRIEGAFPRRLAPTARAVAQALPRARHAPTARDIGPVVIEAETLRIPYRIYVSEPDPIEADGAPIGALVRNCLLTRHADGHIRERALDRIVGSLEPWVVPFVVQLVGEYVVEIVEAAERALSEEHRVPYGTFAVENAPFMALTRARVTSYWACYYRGEYTRDDYPAERLLRRIERWSAAP